MTLSNPEIIDLLESYARESKAIKKDLLTTCWFMRGGISYDDAMMLCYEDRKLINDIIENNLETTKNSGMPFF